MICYKDMTFCRFYKECMDSKDCPRCLTPEVVSQADICDLPVCQFVSPPMCFRPVEEQGNAL